MSTHPTATDARKAEQKLDRKLADRIKRAAERSKALTDNAHPEGADVA